jgi:hypothetical protein
MSEDDLSPGGTSHLADLELPPAGGDESAPLGVKLLVCFLLLDSVRRIVDIVVHGTADALGPPPVAVFVLWALIDLLLGLLLLLRTRAGRYWTQAILTIHVAYLGWFLAIDRPYLWLVLTPGARARVVATLFVDGLFVAYLTSATARAYLDEGP